jgi:hypothetical protein
MTTRRVEKELRRKQKIEKIEVQARRRSVGRAMKDDGHMGHWNGPEDRISYSRREDKQLRSKGK